MLWTDIYLYDSNYKYLENELWNRILLILDSYEYDVLVVWVWSNNVAFEMRKLARGTVLQE